MRRRTFATGALVLGGALAGALAAPRIARAQQALRVHRLALVEIADSPTEMVADGLRPYRALFAELARLGYVEGRNLAVERHSADGRTDRVAAIAHSVATANPDVVLVRATRPTLALKEATATVPIVSIAADPITRGIVTNLARPGGNVTGFSSDAGLDTLPAKRVQLLREIVPGMAKLAFLTHRFFADSPAVVEQERAAAALGLAFVPVYLDDPVDEAAFARAFAAMSAAGVDGLHLSTIPEVNTYVTAIARLAAGARIPTIYPWREGPDAGGLVSYGTDYADLYRRAADYIDRILRGTKPGDLPFQQPTRFELVVNMKAAKSLNVTVPQTIMIFADDVIE